MPSFHYRCHECGKTFARDDVRYLCPECGKDCRAGIPLPGVLEAVFESDARQTFDREHPDWSLLCAVEPAFHPPYPMVPTPFAPLPRLGAELGMHDLWVKNDGLLPSGSLKDRASFLVVAEARRLGERTVVAASTGNAASALAAVCASAGIQALIFVPEGAPKAKLVQMLVSGARVVRVQGTYDEAFRLSLEYTARRGGLNRNTAYHPLTIEGKKTAALEIVAQNGFRAPELLLVSVGDGVILAGLHKGFRDLRDAGLIPSLPRLVGVQAEHSDALHRYVETGIYSDAPHPRTVADSISVACPSNAHLARKAVLESGGFTLTVSDTEILDAQALLGRRTGLFAEPAAAAALAGLVKLRQSCDPRLDPRAQTVLLLTGHGLKDPEAALARVEIPAPIPPLLEAVP